MNSEQTIFESSDAFKGWFEDEERDFQDTFVAWNRRAFTSWLQRAFEAGQQSVPPAVAGGPDSAGISQAQFDHTNKALGRVVMHLQQIGIAAGLDEAAAFALAVDPSPVIDRLVVANAAEMEHKMAAAEWALRESNLKEMIEAGNNACRVIGEHLASEERLARDMSEARDLVVARCRQLEKSLGELGCYLSGLKTYDEDPTAQRIVKRALALLRSAAGGQEPGVGADAIDNGQLIIDNEEEENRQPIINETRRRSWVWVCENCDSAWAVQPSLRFCGRCGCPRRCVANGNVPRFGPKPPAPALERPRQGMEHVVATDSGEVPFDPTGDDWNAAAKRLFESGRVDPGPVHRPCYFCGRPESEHGPDVAATGRGMCPPAKTDASSAKESVPPAVAGGQDPTVLLRESRSIIFAAEIVIKDALACWKEKSFRLDEGEIADVEDLLMQMHEYRGKSKSLALQEPAPGS